MENKRHHLVSRLHLLQMAALTQRTVDLAFKAYELHSLDFSREAFETEKKLHEIELSIGNRGRRLLAAGKLMDSASRSACCALRIYSALRITHVAAIELARNARLTSDQGHLSAPPAMVEMAKFVNGLVRLNTVAVFNRDAQHAKTVLRAEERRRKYDLWQHRVNVDLQELAISRCLEQIAEQAYEIADAVSQLLESHRPGGGRRTSGSDVSVETGSTLCSKTLSSFPSRSRLPNQEQCFGRRS